MQTAHLPRTPGIYKITNSVNGKQYVGSAKDLQARAHGHRRELLKGTHTSKKLQADWNTFPAFSFTVSVIEHVPDTAELIDREQFWIDVLGVCDTGYNTRRKAESNLGIKWSDESCRNSSAMRCKPVQGFITPDGYPVTILNIGMFCKLNGFFQKGFRGIVYGLATSYRGWTHANAKPMSRKWKEVYTDFIDPDGREVPAFTNLRDFCRERGLDSSNMVKVYKGTHSNHKGWTRKPLP